MHDPRNAARVLGVLALAACGGSPSASDVEEAVATTLTLSEDSVELVYIGESARVRATVLDQNGARMSGGVSWSSRDPGVATVSGVGVVRAVANGTTTVDVSVGNLAETVTVTVRQIASVVAIVSGNGQWGLAGTELPDPLVVQVKDRAGTPVEGVEVTFALDPNSGAVDPGTATSDPEGLASTVWTLAARFGPHRLVATIDGAQTELTAFAGSDTPTPDLYTSDPVQIRRSDPSSLESFTASTVVRNQGDGEAGASRLALLVDGVEVATADLPSLAPSAEELVELTVGPLAAGSRLLTIVADADDALLELDETNNAAQRSVAVILQEVIDPGSSVSDISAAGDEDVLFRVDVPGPPTSLSVDVSGGTGDVDLWIEGGDRPRNRLGYDDCISDGPTMTERCQVIGAEGAYHVILHAANGEPFSGATLAVSVGGAVDPFDLELVFVDQGTASQDQAFLDAASVWGSIIVGDVPDYDLGGTTVPADQCMDGQPPINGVIDDVKIYVAIRAIDGPLGTLARAGPCLVRYGSGLPIVGGMEFDEDDLDRIELDGDMEEVVLHEMGHVLGIGTIWARRELLQAPSTGFDQGGCSVTNPTADTHFTGALAIEAFDDAGGVGYGGAKVPVANGELGSGCGSADAHWRESVLDDELMTPFLDGLTVNPLSAITVQSLADIGYGVDVGRAEAYVLPATAAPALVAPAVDPTGAKGLIDLGDDIRVGPIWVMERAGHIVRILR